MRCPLLREAQVRFCTASPYRKLIVRLPVKPEQERCSSAEYVLCSSARQHFEERPSADHCPFLQESLMQYCGAAAVPKFIPYSEAVASRCTGDGHNTCAAFAALATHNPSTRRKAVGNAQR